MIKGNDFEISKDIYDRAQEHYGWILSEDQDKIFDNTWLLGYGVYRAMAYEKDGKYYCSWYHGESCD